MNCFARKFEYEISHGRSQGYLAKIGRAAEDFVFYRFILFIFLFGFMEFMIAGHYSSHLLKTQYIKVWSEVFTYVGFSGTLIILPLCYYWIYGYAGRSYKKFSVLQYVVRD